MRLDELDQQLVGQLVDRARSEGLQLTGEGGLLAELTKMIIESAAEGEMDDHLGYGTYNPAGRDGGNPRMAHGPRAFSPISGRWRSRSRGIATGRLSRRSCASVSAACPASNHW